MLPVAERLARCGISSSLSCGTWRLVAWYLPNFRKKKLPQTFRALLSRRRLQQVQPNDGKILWVYTVPCPSRHKSTNIVGSVTPLRLFAEVQTEGLFKLLQGKLRDVRGSSSSVAVRNLNLNDTDVGYRVFTKGLTTSLYFINFCLNNHITKAKPQPVIAYVAYELWYKR